MTKKFVVAFVDLDQGILDLRFIEHENAFEAAKAILPEYIKYRGVADLQDLIDTLADDDYILEIKEIK